MSHRDKDRDKESGVYCYKRIPLQIAVVFFLQELISACDLLGWPGWNFSKHNKL